MNSSSRTCLSTSILKKSCLSVLVSLALVANVNAQQPVQTTQYEVPAGNLTQVINQISRTSSVQIIYDIELLRGKRAARIAGEMTLSQALDRALSGSGLIWKQVNPTTISIQRSAGAEDRRREDAKIPSATSPEVVHTLSEVLVVGSRTLNADVERTRDDIQPYVVFSAEDIDASLAGDVEEFLRTRLPMNQTSGPTSRTTPEANTGNRSRLDLRGLGANQTLVLVNGRRMPGVSTINETGDTDQPDINGIPMAAIERIEVLPSTASGIHGGGATGGVVNIVLKSTYSATDIKATVDNTFDTDSLRYRVDLTSGFSMFGGRTNVLLGASYSESNQLLVGDRDYARRGRELAYQNDPVLARQIAGARTNFRSADGSPLVLDNGTPYGSSFGSVPVGYMGSDGGLGLLVGAGQIDLSLPNASVGSRAGLFSAPRTSSVLATVKHRVTESIDGYLDVGVMRNVGTTRWSGFANSRGLSANSQANPFQQRVLVSYVIPGEEDLQESRSETRRLTAGLVARLGQSWSAGADINLSKSIHETARGAGYDPLALSLGVGSGDIDIFRDYSLSPPDLSAFRGTASKYGPAEVSMREATLRAGGPLALLPAGQMWITGSLSYRKELSSDVVSGSGPYRLYPERFQEVASAYAEVNAPLIDETMSVPLVQSLDAQLSVRRDEYKTQSLPSGIPYYLDDQGQPTPQVTYSTNRATSTDYTAGFKWQITGGFAARASYGTGFLPPALSQVASEVYESNAFVVDPRRGNVLDMTPYIPLTYGGNPDLSPEQSRSTSIGLILEPLALPNWRLSVDYTKIEKDDEIGYLSEQETLDYELLLPGRVGRGPNAPTDPAGWAGEITYLDLSAVNFASSQVEAVDFQLDYRRETSRGALHAYGIATMQTSLEKQITPDAEVIDRVGYSDGVLRWRSILGGSFQRGDWSIGVALQWYDRYRVYSSTATQSARESGSRLQGSEYIPSQWYMDLSLKRKFLTGWLTGTEMSLGVRNVLGNDPRTVATLDPRSGYSSYADPRHQSYVFSVKKSF